MRDKRGRGRGSPCSTPLHITISPHSTIPSAVITDLPEVFVNSVDVCRIFIRFKGGGVRELVAEWEWKRGVCYTHTNNNRSSEVN